MWIGCLDGIVKYFFDHNYHYGARQILLIWKICLRTRWCPSSQMCSVRYRVSPLVGRIHLWLNWNQGQHHCPRVRFCRLRPRWQSQSWPRPREDHGRSTTKSEFDLRLRMIKSSKGRGSGHDLFGDGPMVGVKRSSPWVDQDQSTIESKEGPGSNYDKVQWRIEVKSEVLLVWRD